jgi:hypothetical protein
VVKSVEETTKFHKDGGGEHDRRISAYSGFQGQAVCPRPASEELGNAFYVTISMEKCLSVYSAESWKVLY